MYTTYDIFDDLLGLRNSFDRFFRDYPESSVRAEFPAVNLYENGDVIEVRAVMPGVQREDLSLELNDNSLVITVERKNDYADKPYMRRERNFGKYHKTVRLAYPVDRGRVDAGLKNGILTVTLYKSEDAKPRRIEVK